MTSTIDLHLHSTVSDGTDSPEELAEKVCRSGIRIFSLSDHDAVDGAERVRETLARLGAAAQGIRFINGVEFSCRDNEGKYHILGYGYDEGNSEVRKLADVAHRIRIGKLEARMDILQSQFDIELSEEEKENLRSEYNPGKPHLGRMLVKKGYAPDIQTAIATYMDPFRVRSLWISPEEAITAIKDSGGVPVLAHGVFGSGQELLDREELEGRITRFQKEGLEGLECWYERYTPEQQAMMIELSRKYGLCATAGSDYHGKNKTVVLGDNHFEEGCEGSELLEVFLERVN